MRIAYLDCFSGASGDMLVGALLDAGLDFEALRGELAKLPLEQAGHASPYQLTFETPVHHGLRGTKFDVLVKRGSHQHRHLANIELLIRESTLPQEVRSRSLAVFHRLALAEAKVHGTTIEEVHFHEVGAVDSIVDVVGFVAGLHLLQVEALHSSPLTVGGGTVRTAHGVLPAPAPATLEILATAGVPTHRHPRADTELLTPTAAALLAELATFDATAQHKPPVMTVTAIGYGFGTKELDWPNALRIWLGEAVPHGHTQKDEVVLVECNLDDVTGEILGYTLERCLEAGALDIWFTPIQMKKNRPGVKISLLATPERFPVLSDLLLRETSTLGVRHSVRRRLKAERRMRTVATPWGEVRLKDKVLNGQVVASSPEYEDCARVARESGVPLAEVYRTAVRLS
jgi:uncharacterized protein (TIGR00299 family) protein